MRHLLLLLTHLVFVPTSLSKADAGTTTVAPSKGAKVEGPYSTIGSLLDHTKKPKFFQLLKKMREIKNDATKPDSLKNSTRRELNSELQKLLGDEIFAKYRQIRVANTAKAKTAGSAGPTAPSKPAPSLPSATAGTKSAKKKKNVGSGRLFKEAEGRRLLEDARERAEEDAPAMLQANLVPFEPIVYI